MFSLEEYVTAGRTGADSRLKLVSAIDIMQDCSQLWMKSEPQFEAYFEENGIAQLLVSRQVDLLRIPVYGEKLKVTTNVFEVQSFQGFRNTVICDEHDKPCIVSWSTGAFVCMDNNRLAKIPTEVLSQMTLDAKVEMEYLERKITISDTGRIGYAPVPVMRNDIDMNRHMNNAHYVRIAIEFLPRDFKVDRLRVEYKTPAAEGDLLYPYMIKHGKTQIFILLLNKNGQSHAVLEFSQLQS